MRREVDHLMHDHVARPGALFAGRAIEVGVVRVEIDAAPSDRPDLVQHGIAAFEEGTGFAGMESLMDAGAAQEQRAIRADRKAEIAEAERLEGLEAVVATARQIAEARALVVGIEPSVAPREFRGGDVDARASRCIEVERHGAGHDLAEVDRDDVRSRPVAREHERPAQRDRFVGLRVLHVAEHRCDGIVLRRSRRHAPRVPVCLRDARPRAARSVAGAAP